MSKPSKRERQERILEKLRSNVTVRISTLADLFSVSTETIRRDIDALTEARKVNRTYGGAASIPLTSEPGISERRHVNVTGRALIAKSAARLVESGDVIMIDSGSTTVHFADALTAYPQSLTILTNCVPVAQRLGSVSAFQVIVCPGKYSSDEHGMFGHETVEFLGQFHANKAFIGAGGVTEDGISEVGIDASWIKRKMIERSDRTLLMTDHEKYGKFLFNSVCGWDDIDDLIVDRDPEPGLLKALSVMRTQVHVAGSEVEEPGAAKSAT